MSGSTLTIRKDSTGKIKSITASGKYAKELFDSMKPVTIPPAKPQA